MLGGASGANTGHFASFFYYTRARALLEGELAAEARKIEYKTKEEKNQSIFQARKINPGWLAGQPAVPRLDTGAWNSMNVTHGFLLKTCYPWI